MSKPANIWIEIDVKDDCTLKMHVSPIDTGTRFIEHSAYEKAIAALKFINKNENTAGACMHIARETLKELGEDGE